MPATVIRGSANPLTSLALTQDLVGVGKTSGALFNGDVVIQATGPATAVTYLVERHAPQQGGGEPSASSPGWCPADVAVSGNPSAGLAAALYAGRGDAWIRINMTAITGPSVSFSITGEG